MRFGMVFNVAETMRNSGRRNIIKWYVLINKWFFYAIMSHWTTERVFYEIYVVTKLTIRHCWQSPFFNRFLLKNKKMPGPRIDSATSNGGQGNLTFPLPPLEAALSISKFCFLFTRARERLFFIYTLLLIDWFPRETTQHQYSKAICGSYSTYA
jgi:hypothetical protein